MANATARTTPIAKVRKRKVFHITLVSTDMAHPFDPNLTRVTAVEADAMGVAVPHGFEWLDGEVVHLGPAGGPPFTTAKIAFTCTRKRRGYIHTAALHRTAATGDPGTGFMSITLEVGGSNPMVDPVPVDFVDDTEN